MLIVVEEIKEEMGLVVEGTTESVALVVDETKEKIVIEVQDAGAGIPQLSREPGNRIEFRPDGLYVKPNSWAGKEW